MRLSSLLAAAVVVVALPLAVAPVVARAETPIKVDRFTAVELHGGGKITIHQGPTQRVTLVEGDPARARFHVSGGRLIMSPCDGFCWGHGRFEVDIETPELNGAGINGGGQIVAEGNFPAQSAVNAFIHGGGDVDLRTVPAQAAQASIHGGGKIYVAAQNSLDASIFGGGQIRYAGHPAVNSSIHGGGSVSSLN
ncbi:MAG: DUF2807 domain-containing protein [Proteobacteria bacterium]|nr:DUF2807 domain-containing protein [Pseudomonadota bacterium]